MKENSKGNTEQTKKCSNCGEIKEVSLFHKDKKGKYGRHSICGFCRREYQKIYHEGNKKYANEYNRNYHKTNRWRWAGYRASRKADKSRNTPKFIRDCPIDKQRRAFAYKLSRLLTETTEVQHHVDHMWPISDGGPHWSGNLQVIPAIDNLVKNSKVDEEIKKTIQEGLEYARRESKRS